MARVEQALVFYRPEAIFLNPDCGFGCFANRCVNDEETAMRKIRQIVRSAATCARSMANQAGPKLIPRSTR